MKNELYHPAAKPRPLRYKITVERTGGRELKRVLVHSAEWELNPNFHLRVGQVTKQLDEVDESIYADWRKQTEHEI